MNWKVKGLVQNALSSVPGGVQVNSFLQRTVGNLCSVEHNVDVKVIADWLVLLCHMREVAVNPQDLDYLEVGTGWYPTLPICYFLIGARSCKTYDINRHLSAKLTWKMLRRLEHHLAAIAEAGGCSIESVAARYQELTQCKTLAQLLDCAHIEYLAPADASSSALPPASVDIVFSNSVLEHVPPETIRNIMCESRRVLRPSGLIIHSANCGDHYAYSDRNITAVNYFMYSDHEWKVWNNSLQYQNRLRPDDFLNMAIEAGFHILLAKHQPQQELLDTLQQIRIAPEFSRYKPEQLATTSVDFVARTPSG